MQSLAEGWRLGLPQVAVVAAAVGVGVVKGAAGAAPSLAGWAVVGAEKAASAAVVGTVAVRVAVAVAMVVHSRHSP